MKKVGLRLLALDLVDSPGMVGSYEAWPQDCEKYPPLCPFLSVIPCSIHSTEWGGGGVVKEAKTDPQGLTFSKEKREEK